MEQKKGLSGLIVAIIVIILGVWIYDSIQARKARDYYIACRQVLTTLTPEQCNCVSNLYLNEQIVRKIRLLKPLPECD